ncbi:MAG: thioredoxin family protein [Candidatus Falkowbacteria bacterium]
MKIVKFSALWCADCIVMRPMWQEINNVYPDILIEEFDIDDYPDVAKTLGVVKAPTTIFYGSDEIELTRLIGIQNQQTLFDYIKRLSET